MAGTGSRTLKLSILGDIDNLKKSLDQGTTEVSSFGDKVTKFGKVAGAAFLAAGVAAAAYAGKLLVDGVKSAIEDEAAQAKLATSLRNVTGATDAQIAAVEKQILKTSLLTGKTDDELRPSLQRLLQSTKDVEEAQKLQTLALNIAAGGTASLEAVSNALAKAHDGNFAALKKLGGGVADSILQSKDFESATAALALTFKDQASIQAETFAGKMARLNVAVNEGKETVGSFVLDAITPMITTIVNDVIPKISEFGQTVGTKLKPYIDDLILVFKEYLIPYFQFWWGFISEILIPGIIKTFKPILEGLFEAFGRISGTIQDNTEKLQPLFDLFMAVAKFIYTTLAPALGTVLGAAIKVIGVAISGLISGFSTLVGLITSVVNGIREMISLVANNPIVKGIGNVISSVFGGARATGGAVTSGTSYLVGEKGAEIFTPSSSGFITPNSAMGGNTVINLNVSGAIDPEGTARSIINVLNNSYYRGTSGAAALVV
jgi:hypothetical protein